MIYWMHGKTFLKQYIHENPDIVCNTQYVIVSSTIRKNGKYKKNYIIASSLIPQQQLLLDYDDYTDNNYVKGYQNEVLDENIVFLATIIKYAIEESATVVFLCGYKEKKYRYLNILQKYIENEFDYHIYNYKKYKKGKEKVVSYDEKLVLHKCNQIIKDAKNSQMSKMLSSEKGREKYIASLSKKELKSKLKKMDLYSKNMSKSEMKDMLDAFI